MRPRSIPSAVALLCLILTACGGTSATPPGSHDRRAGAAHPQDGGQTRTIHQQHTVPAGVSVERLAPPPGRTIHPVCQPRTLIGTITAPSVTARTRPQEGATAIATFRRVSEQGVRQVFDLVGETTGPSGHEWYKALLPLRPNGTLGYIPADRLHVTWTDDWLLVERARFRLTLFQSCRSVAQFPVGIGEGSTPTPVGYFYLQSLLQPPDPNGVYGTYAFGLSGYSEVIHDWRWGGVVGLHGTNDPSGIGHYVSHGCIRMFNADINKLARILPLGTPIAIA